MVDNKTYFGIYRGVVVNADDPEERGRVKLIIPQVSGENVTEWALPVTGSISQRNWPYGTFYTNADQTVGINTATVVNNWNEADTNRSYLDGNKIYVEETGDYLLQFSTMFIKTNAASGTADMWVRINGVDVPDSNTRVTLSGSNAEVVMSVSSIIDLDAGDYVQLVASASSSNILISHSGASTGPAVPGVIATLSLIGKWKPQPETGVWVMFEGGDPNFPVWLGAI